MEFCRNDFSWIPAAWDELAGSGFAMTERAGAENRVDLRRRMKSESPCLRLPQNQIEAVGLDLAERRRGAGLEQWVDAVDRRHERGVQLGQAAGGADAPERGRSPPVRRHRRDGREQRLGVRSRRPVARGVRVAAGGWWDRGVAAQAAGTRSARGGWYRQFALSVITVRAGNSIPVTVDFLRVSSLGVAFSITLPALAFLPDLPSWAAGRLTAMREMR